MKILVVDDCLSLQAIMEDMLQYLDYTDIHFADSAEEALEKVPVLLPDCILLDWHMPGMSGLDLLKQLKKDVSTKDIPIIMLTAESSMENVKKAVEDGAEGYILKPINEVLLRARLKDVEKEHLLGLKK
ncbi:MAG: response regulator [Chitinivibrionales bacterium]|nr:response regulator [Chitinivibrionales bacterium]